MDEMEKQSCMDVPEPNEHSVEDRSGHCEQVGQIEETLVSWTELRLDKYCLFCSTRRFLNSPVPLVCCSIGTSVGIPARRLGSLVRRLGSSARRLGSSRRLFARVVDGIDGPSRRRFGSAWLVGLAQLIFYFRRWGSSRRLCALSCR